MSPHLIVLHGSHELENALQKNFMRHLGTSSMRISRILSSLLQRFWIQDIEHFCIQFVERDGARSDGQRIANSFNHWHQERLTAKSWRPACLLLLWSFTEGSARCNGKKTCAPFLLMHRMLFLLKGEWNAVLSGTISETGALCVLPTCQPRPALLMQTLIQLFFGVSAIRTDHCDAWPRWC